MFFTHVNLFFTDLTSATSAGRHLLPPLQGFATSIAKAKETRAAEILATAKEVCTVYVEDGTASKNTSIGNFASSIYGKPNTPARVPDYGGNKHFFGEKGIFKEQGAVRFS